MLIDFILVSLLGGGLILISWLFTYEILGQVWGALPKIGWSPRLRVMLIGVPIFFLHIANIWLYAGVYFLVENYTALGRIVGTARLSGLTLASFFDCLYFSAVTYTSLGLGDLVPTLQMRMLAAAEVLNGLVMIGWTISFTYLTMEKFWSQPFHRRHSKAPHE